MKKSKAGIYQSSLLEFPDIVHGFSTRQFGDMRDKKKRDRFLTAMEIDETSLVQQEQIHKDAIYIVTPSDRGRTIPGADGLVYKQSPDDTPLVLSIHTADCVPILVVDPMKRIIGVAHAGWKGTSFHIGKKCIGEMEKLGANASDILVVIGPRIGVCCYQITSDRAEVFLKEFPGSDVVGEKDGNFFADIGKANYIDLVAVGVKPEHIDYDSSLCTCCMTDDFYSFRKSNGVLEGEMLTVIGFRKPI